MTGDLTPRQHQVMFFTARGLNGPEIGKRLGISPRTVEIHRGQAVRRLGAFKPISRGPQNGAPPSLEFVSIDRLQVDATYQRATDGSNSRRIIIGMVKKWDWALCQPLVVSRRIDGALFVLDGQHRLAGARERGDIAHLPCVVLSSVDIAGEARAFVDLNTQRQKLSQFDIFTGQLAAGDANAHAVMDLLTETGWSLAKHNASNDWKPGVLNCAPMLALAYARLGDQPIRMALQVLRKAWPDRAVSCSARLLGALIQIFRAPSAANYADEMAKAMRTGAATPNHWLVKAENEKLSNGGTITEALINVLKHAAGMHATVSKSPPPQLSAPRAASPAIATRPAAPKPGAPAAAFGTSGKGWCEQCERLVNRDTATACRSIHCKMKVAA